MNCKINGFGDPLVLIHGWGMNGKVWDNIESKLSKQFKLYIFNLPGMGGCPYKKEYAIDKLIDSMNEYIPHNSSLLGWSLGGQIAMAYHKKYSEKIKRLILVSSTPCFINKKDWYYGVEKEIFEEFESQLLLNWKKTIKKFMLLQFDGLINSRKLATTLENNILKLADPSPEALSSSLKLLLRIDYREDLKNIHTDTLIISGDKDKITPFSSSQFMAKIIPTSTLHLIPGAGHIPFLYNPKVFINSVTSFLKK